MIRKIVRVTLIVLAALIVLLGLFAAYNRDLIQRVLLGGLKVYETTPPALPADIRRPAILIFSKTNGFRHADAIPAANNVLAGLAKEKGWGAFQTENGAAFRPDILARFDAVVFNNTSGDVFTPEQRAAFQSFVEKGGGYVGIHAAGDDSHKAWGWYMDKVIGTAFIGHPMSPQFQKAAMRIEDRAHPATRHLGPTWQRTDEWYSFDRSPRKPGITVLATLDEASYSPKGMFGKDLAMGKDHPIVWARCVGKGRALYSALGHTPESFREPQHRQLLAGAIAWTLRQDGDGCDAPATEAAR
ncbi:MAG: ThuA domain-containing protein [Sphingomonadaceae bacterium]